MKIDNNTSYFMLIPNRGFSLDELEKGLIIQALENCHFNKSEAARMLGITRSRFRSMLKRFKIKS